MCSIIGIAGENFPVNELLERLKRMEYRGYDSFGYWDSQTLEKSVGQVRGESEAVTRTAIGHTRWATHGRVTQKNAHPHRAGKTTIVHNGIITNWKSLKKELEEKGAHFISETDSEVVAWFIEFRRKEKAMPEVLEEVIERFEGTFSVVATIDGDEKLYVIKRGSPLLIGISEKNVFVASDVYAFSDRTNRAVVLDDDEYAMISLQEQIFFKKGVHIEKQVKEFAWVEKDLGLGKHEHHMHKEIFDQPAVAETLIAQLQNDRSFARLKELIGNAKKVIFTACGTAYFASLVGVMAFHDTGIEAQALIASEFKHFARLPEGSLVIAVSQSGETMDTIKALRYAKEEGATIASIVNVPFSTIERASEVSVKIHAGQEVAVASTKAFTNQSLLLLALAGKSLDTAPEMIARVLEKESWIANIAKEIRGEHLYILGRQYGYPIAREIALKIKEVSYVHAEGMMAGELKHGTIALIEEDTPVIGIVYDDDPEMRSSLAEVAARGANVITIGTAESDTIVIENCDRHLFGVLCAIVGQLFSYHLAKEKSLPIDKPRNLAKSVTV